MRRDPILWEGFSFGAFSLLVLSFSRSDRIVTDSRYRGKCECYHDVMEKGGHLESP